MHVCTLTITQGKICNLHHTLNFSEKVMFHLALDISEPCILLAIGFVFKNVTSSFS